jgi:hypothetical protein
LSKITLLNEFQSEDIFPLRTPEGLAVSRSPGTYLKTSRIQGNSILSSLFIKSLDPGASVTINYFDNTTGDLFGERYDLESHGTQTVAGSTDRITVTRIHNKPICEAIVAGGNAEFGVYITVVSSFASELDRALVNEGQLAVPSNQGIPVVCYDESTNKFFFLRCTDGKISVSDVLGSPGVFAGSFVSTPGFLQTPFSVTVPGGKKYHLVRNRLVCRSHSSYEILIDGSAVGSGATGPGYPVDDLQFHPINSVANAGQLIEIQFKTLVGGGPVIGVDYQLRYSSEDV